MTGRSAGRALAVAAVVLTVASCGVRPQSEPVRLDSDTATPPVPTVTQRPDDDASCPTPTPTPTPTAPGTDRPEGAPVSTRGPCPPAA